MTIHADEPVRTGHRVHGRSADQDAAEALRQARVMLDAHTEGLLLLGRGGRVLDWNAAAEFTLGLTAGELDGRTPNEQSWRAIHLDGTPWPLEQTPAALAATTGHVIPEHIMGIHRPDGELVWLSVHARPLHGADGSITGALVAFHDVTASIDLQRRSAEISHRMQVAMENGSVGTALLDGRTRITYVNRALTELVGTAAELLIGLRLVDIFHPADPAVHELRTNDVSSLTDHGRDVQLSGRTGLQRWARLNLTALPPVDGTAASLVQLTDITERRELETKMRRNEELARRSLDAIEHGVIYASPTLGIQRMNPAATAILGYEADELYELWMSPTWKIHDEHGRPIAAEEFAGVRAIEASEPVYHQILWLRHRDGTWRRVRMSAVPFGWTDEVILFFTDITDFTPPDAARPIG